MKTSEYSVSVVVPLYNEAPCVRHLHARLSAVMKGGNRPYELVLVNDGSRDGTREELFGIQREDPSVKVVDLARNCGQTAALAAGFANCRGNVIIPMDGDLQHEPEEIPLFLEKIDEGYDIVSGWRQGRRESLLLRKVPSWIANRLMAMVSGVPLHDFGTTFKAYRREILQRLCLYGDFHRFIPVLAKPLGASVAEVPIRSPERVSGRSKYGIRRTFTVLFDILRIRFLLSFLTRPLHFFGSVGMALMFAGGVMGVVLLHDKYVRGLSMMTDRGPFMMAAIVLLLAGLQMLSIGFLGEILSRLYHETRPDSVYSVREVRGEGLGAP